MDSYPVLEQAKEVRIIDKRTGKEIQGVTGVKAQLYTLWTLGALVFGLCIWFGEAYAAGLYNNDGRTGIFSALFIVAPATVFVSILGIHASLLPVEILVNGKDKTRKEKFTEYFTENGSKLVIFGLGITGLLLTHNPLLCLGFVLIIATLFKRADHVLDIVRNHIEIDIILVLFIALMAGPIMVELTGVLGIGTGTILPIIPATFQAVLWGPIYEDPSVHFWIRLTTLSTGAMLTPLSSLVGVMLFKTKEQWKIYMRYSIPYAALWYMIMRTWIYFTLEAPLGESLEQFAHSVGH